MSELPRKSYSTWRLFHVVFLSAGSVDHQQLDSSLCVVVFPAIRIYFYRIVGTMGLRVGDWGLFMRGCARMLMTG